MEKGEEPEGTKAKACSVNKENKSERDTTCGAFLSPSPISFGSTQVPTPSCRPEILGAAHVGAKQGATAWSSGPVNISVEASRLPIHLGLFTSFPPSPFHKRHKKAFDILPCSLVHTRANNISLRTSTHSLLLLQNSLSVLVDLGNTHTHHP